MLATRSPEYYVTAPADDMSSYEDEHVPAVHVSPAEYQPLHRGLAEEMPVRVSQAMWEAWDTANAFDSSSWE